MPLDIMKPGWFWKLVCYLAEDPETSIFTGGDSSGAKWLPTELQEPKVQLETMEHATLLMKMLDFPQDIEWDFEPFQADAKGKEINR